MGTQVVEGEVCREIGRRDYDLDVIVYVLTHDEANEGGTVEGVYSSEQKAREGAADARLPGGGETIFFWKILPVEVDGRAGDLDSIRID